MNRVELTRTAFLAVVAMGEQPTRRSVTAMLYRICGKAFRSEEVGEVISSLRDAPPEKDWEPNGNQTLFFQGTNGHAQTLVTQGSAKNWEPSSNGHREPSRDPLALARVEGISLRDASRLLLPTSFASLSTWEGGQGRKKLGAANSEPSLPEAWATTLREKVRGLSNVELKDLSGSERALVGRYHAFRFGNCTRSEDRNRVRGLHVAAALAQMASSPQFADFSVGEYFGIAAEYHETAGKQPWFRPWDIAAICGTDVLSRTRSGKR